MAIACRPLSFGDIMIDRQIACSVCHQRSVMSNSYCIYCGVIFPKVNPEPEDIAKRIAVERAATRHTAMIFDEINTISGEKKPSDKAKEIPF